MLFDWPTPCTILGGTHGNETNGVFVVDSYKANPALVKRPSFSDVLLVTTNTNARAPLRAS